MNIQNGLFVSVLLLRGDTVFATSAGITLWRYLNFCGRSGFLAIVVSLPFKP